EALASAARDRRHHPSRHAGGLSRHDRLEARDVHDLRRDEGRCAAQDLRHRVIAEIVQTTWMMRDFEFISRRSLADRLAAWIAAAGVVPANSQFGVGQGRPKNFVMHDAPKPVAAIKLDDAQGQSRNLADFKGKVVLLNIWATWCGPCRKEMPALDRLQAELGGPDFEVVALSIDRGGMDAVRKFFADIGIRNLAMYLDSSGQALRTLSALG